MLKSVFFFFYQSQSNLGLLWNPNLRRNSTVKIPIIYPIPSHLLPTNEFAKQYSLTDIQASLTIGSLVKKQEIDNTQGLMKREDFMPHGFLLPQKCGILHYTFSTSRIGNLNPLIKRIVFFLYYNLLSLKEEKKSYITAPLSRIPLPVGG